MLKTIDNITHQSGYMSRNIAIAIYIMYKDKEILQYTIETSDAHTFFYARIDIHKDNPKLVNLLYKFFPNIFVKEVNRVFNNHFDQWRETTALHFVIASKEPFIEP